MQGTKKFFTVLNLSFHRNEIVDRIILPRKLIVQAYSISGPRATSGQRHVSDWPDNGLYYWLIKFTVVSSYLPFGHSLQHN
jgi:hypothetical protein